MEAHYHSRFNKRSSSRSLIAGVRGKSLALTLSLFCLATLSSFSLNDNQSSFVVVAVNLHIHHRQRSEDDDDDLNVDPNMAGNENQYMFGAAVNQVVNNQEDK